MSDTGSLETGAVQKTTLLELSKRLFTTQKGVAATLYARYAGVFEEAVSRNGRMIPHVDLEAQTSCSVDDAFGDPARRINVYLGPATEDASEMHKYPKASFLFRKKGSKWDYWHTRVGVSGTDISLHSIVGQHANEGSYRKYLETAVAVADVDRLLPVTNQLGS